MTPDSFSDGGRFFDTDQALKHAHRMIEEGADVIDIGGESTRPHAVPVPQAEEIARVLPVIKSLIKSFPSLRISIDTTKYEVARAALDAGATIVNDVSGFRIDPRLAGLCASANCKVILMHSRGEVQDMALYTHASYPAGVVEGVIEELTDRVAFAELEGVDRQNVILDPGIGFSKESGHSWEILANLDRIVDLGLPIMVGVSRKRFLGELIDSSDPADRDEATVGANVAAYCNGARWFRVHNVGANRKALDVAAAIIGRKAVIPLSRIH